MAGKSEKAPKSVKKLGRPRWELTPERLLKIRDMAHKGCTEKSIAAMVNCSVQTFEDKKKEYPEILEALHASRSAGEDEAVGYMWKILRDPNHKMHAVMLMFYLKTQHRWREKEPAAAAGESAGKPGFEGYTITVIPPKDGDK